MGLQEAEPMTQLIDVAQRLRMVRAARRRFLAFWAIQCEARRLKHRENEAKSSPSRLRRSRLFDDL
jgi:hypothetical protein